MAAFWKVMLELDAPVTTDSSTIFAAVVSTATDAVVMPTIFSDVNAPVVTCVLATKPCPTAVPEAPAVRTVTRNSAKNGWLVMLATAGAVTVVVMLPVKVVVPIRTVNTVLPGELDVVIWPAAVIRNVVPAAIVLAGMVQATTCASALTIAAEAATEDPHNVLAVGTFPVASRITRPVEWYVSDPLAGIVTDESTWNVEVAADPLTASVTPETAVPVVLDKLIRETNVEPGNGTVYSTALPVPSCPCANTE